MDGDREVTAAALSVGDLVRGRLSDTDRWNLATVQRDEVWDEVRMRHLLDSLLTGYPVGAILLCRTKEASRVIEVEGRQDTAAADRAWQLLDGQQRINALFSMLTPRGNYGQFFLDMTSERVAPGPAQRRANKGRSLGHIIHRATKDGGEFDRRNKCIDLSRWAEWADSPGRLDRLRTIGLSEIGEELSSLDPEFTVALDPPETAIARDRLMAMIGLWTESRIPVLRAELEGPLDVLEVFTRINLGGVNVAGVDVYFAGVKTFWSDAEKRLEQLRDQTPFLKNRMNALRFLSRLASRGLGYGDPLPLAVDRLVGPQGDSVLRAMRELTDDDSEALKRIGRFSSWYQCSSELGYVLQQVTNTLWDDVLAWAAASARSDNDWYGENRDLIDSYLLGATIFGYRSVMGDTFHRLALLEALHAGAAGDPFPMHRIVSVARASTRLRGGRGRAVLTLTAEGDRAQLAQRNAWLLIALEQRIPFSWLPEENFDWDHIFPKSQASRMWAPGAGGRHRHHRHRHLINSPGNFWALNASVNRSLKDTVGMSKFEALRAWANDTAAKAKVWPLDRWSITDEEIQSFIRIDDLLTQDPDSVDRGMELFNQTVTARGKRLFESALKRFPLVELFARDDDSEELDSPAEAHVDFREALELSDGAPPLHAATVDEVRRIFHRRGTALSTALLGRLSDHPGVARHWLWPHRRQGPTKCVAFELAEGNCIELVMKWRAGAGVSMLVKAYPTYNRESNRYPSFDEVALGAEWTAPNSVIVDAFLTHVDRLQEEHPHAANRETASR
jgi:hypothetical protein